MLGGQHATEQRVQDKPRCPRRSSKRRTSHCVVPHTGDDFEAGGLAEHWIVKGPSQPRGEGSHDLPALAPGRAAPPIVGRAEFPAHPGPPSRSEAATLPAHRADRRLHRQAHIFAGCLQQRAIVEGHRWRLGLDSGGAGNVPKQIFCTLADF